MPNCNSRSVRIPTSVTLDPSQTYISANEKQVQPKCHHILRSLRLIVENDRDSSSTSFRDNLVDQNFTSKTLPIVAHKSFRITINNDYVM